MIVLGPREATAGDLRSLVERHPDTFVGGSVWQSLARTATAYGQAVSALAVARFRPDKTAVYAERTHPERLMDPAALRTWAARVLRPLDALPHHTRAELLATTRLGLGSPPSPPPRSSASTATPCAPARTAWSPCSASTSTT